MSDKELEVRLRQLASDMAAAFSMDPEDAARRLREALFEALHGHLTADLQCGGHGFSEASRTVVWDATDEYHEYDHTAGTWFSDALLHAHDGNAADPGGQHEGPTTRDE